MKLPKELLQNNKKVKRTSKTKMIEWSKSISEVNRKCRFKGCLYPNKKECSSKLIKAHSIQRNTILKTISDSGEVMSFDMRTSFITGELNRIGLDDASTFFGFCSYHDATIFTDIENQDYANTKKQNFLFAYRACTLEYVKCKYALCHTKEMIKSTPDPITRAMYFGKLKKDEADLKDIEKKLYLFSKELIKPEHERNYAKLHSICFKLEQKTLLAVNSAICLNYDFDGNQVFNPRDYNIDLPTLFLNIFPQGDATFIVISCFSNSYKVYKTIIKEMIKMSPNKIKNLFSQVVVTHCENFFLSPSKWLKLSERKRENFLSKFSSTPMGSQDRLYLTKTPSLNLFNILKS